MTGIDVIDNDSILVPWNLECSDLFSSCYEFNTHNMACWFDKKLEKKNSASVALNRNLEKIEEANKVYISNQGATLWQKKINLKNRNVAA